MLDAELRYLVELHKTRSITKTANNLFLDQSTVSKALKNLGCKFGIELYKSTHSGVTFTPKGEEIVQLTKQIMDQYTKYKIDVLNCCNDAKTYISGNLNVFASRSLTLSILPKVVNNFINAYPNIHVNIDEVETKKVPHVFMDNNPDLVFVNTRDDVLANHPKFHQFEIIFINHMTLCVVMDKYHPLREKVLLNPEDVLPYPWIICSHADHHIVEISDGDTDKLKVILKVENIDIAFESLLRTNSLTCYPHYVECHPYIKNRQLLSKPFNNKVQYKTYCFFMKDSPRRDLIELFINNINIFAGNVI